MASCVARTRLSGQASLAFVVFVYQLYTLAHITSCLVASANIEKLCSSVDVTVCDTARQKKILRDAGSDRSDGTINDRAIIPLEYN